MEEFKEIFVNFVDSINKKLKTKDELFNFVRLYCNKDYFYNSIKDLMEFDDIWVRLYASSIGIDYNIEPKKAKKVVLKILKKESFDLYSVEAELVLDKYKKKYKGFSIFFNKK